MHDSYSGQFLHAYGVAGRNYPQRNHTQTVVRYNDQTEMKNKIILILITILPSITTVSSQEKFIEVLVKDTITLKPISYEFQVMSGLKFRYNYENPNSESEFLEKLRKEEKRITDGLKKWGYEFSLNNNPEASITTNITDKRNYIVKIKNSTQKEEFKTRMKAEGINFYMSNIIYENRESKIKEIYKRLLKKAKERAELIAELSGKKVGEIIEISESKSELSIISSFIENFAYSRSNGASSTSFQFNAGVFEKSILVKYEVE